MTLLRDIQAAAAESTVPVGVLLRKCKVLAARLDDDRFTEWTDLELNGYPSGHSDRLPPYRKLRDLEARGNFSGGFGHYINGGLIPQECVDPDDREALFSVDMTKGVAEYEALVAQLEGGETNGKLVSPWPSGAVIKYADRV